MKKPEPVSYTVTPETLSAFKEPFGKLIQGPPEETMAKLGEIVCREKPPKIISVGDTVSHNLHKHGIIPQLAITDNLAMRKTTEQQQFENKRLIKVKNPQGTITKQALDAVQKALATEEHTHILVDGEEDLLTLTVVLYAPDNSIVVYGQPNKGIVVVKASVQKKREAEKIWKALKAKRDCNFAV